MRVFQKRKQNRLKSNRLSGTRAATGRNWFSQYDLCERGQSRALELSYRKMRYKPFKNAIARIGGRQALAHITRRRAAATYLPPLWRLMRIDFYLSLFCQEIYL